MIVFKSNPSIFVFTLSIVELFTVISRWFQSLYTPYINPKPNITAMKDIIIGKNRLSFIVSAPGAVLMGLFSVPFYLFYICFQVAFVIYIVVGEFKFPFLSRIKCIRK